jgi:hypothetical protein
MERAQSKKLPIKTETDPGIVKFYSRMGFDELGRWNTHTPEPTQKVRWFESTRFSDA